MVDVTIEGDRALFNVEGTHKLWSFRSVIEIPLAHITGVEADPDQVGRWWHGIKLIGTDVPGLFAAGTFYYHGEIVFWDVRDPAQHRHRVARARALQEADYRSVGRRGDGRAAARRAA